MTNQDETTMTTVEKATATPVEQVARISAVDILRGVGLLGILMINIEFFALPSVIYFDPSVAGGFEGLNLLTYRFASAVFLQKMMAIFSMLFGAGLVLMWDRFEDSGRKLGKVYYRRIAWLFLIALVHSYLIWYGDILYAYSMIGFLLFLFRRRSPRALIIIGVSVLLVGMLMQYGSGYQFGMLRTAAEEVAAAESGGPSPTPMQVAQAEAWEEVKVGFTPTDESLEAEYEAYRGGYSENLAHRVPETIMMQTQAFFFFMLWRAAGLMLLGMGLMKLGVFSASKSKRFYLLMAVCGYVIGLPLSVYGTGEMIAHDFDLVHMFTVGNQIAYVASILVALGHVGVVMLICKSALLTGMKKRLAAVGQMALTNYLAQSIICTTIFYGFGFGLFGTIERFHLIWFVLGVWALQLIYSPIWLKHFRFGPAEWVWRSLTYWKPQPMKIR